MELPRSEVFKWSTVYFASRQGLKRDIFGGGVSANTNIFFHDERGLVNFRLHVLQYPMTDISPH